MSAESAIGVDLSWCEIDAEALAANVSALRSLHPGRLLGVVVKGDAYGHGLVACAKAFVAAGADWLIVNRIDEAQTLRAAGIVADYWQGLCDMHTVSPGPWAL